MSGLDESVEPIVKTKIPALQKEIQQLAGEPVHIAFFAWDEKGRFYYCGSQGVTKQILMSILLNVFSRWLSRPLTDTPVWARDTDTKRPS